MGFGYGYSSRSDHGGKRYNNRQTAHVWNAQTERRGQSNNGNFYFEGAALYSYGSHFLVAYIMPDGVALFNADSYSVSTSGHQSDARGAASNRDSFSIAGLTALYPLLANITAGKLDSRQKKRARDLIREHAGALAKSRRYAAGVSDDYEWLDEPDEHGRRYRIIDRSEAETAGAYLTRMAGLPAASWPKLEREAAKAKAKREAEAAKRDHRAKLDSAVRLADMTDSEFRKALAVANPEHNGVAYAGEAEARLKRLSLNLLRALKLANAEGFSKRRRETLKRRRKETAERLAIIAELESIVLKRRQLRDDIRLVRALQDEWRGHENELPSDYWRIRNLGNGAEALKRLSESAAFPAATRERLRFEAARVEATCERFAAEWDRVQTEKREAERRAREMELADYKRAWLAGEVPLARTFDAESGGAALRIKGERLETSHGAEVPLAEAVRAFRFIKLCREHGREWQANGQQIRVGSFRLDWINAAGDMKAGCHRFTWPEIERAAKLAGVVDCPADDAAVITRESINA